jgi:8-oxo-dGTP diphosphatase
MTARDEGAFVVVLMETEKTENRLPQVLLQKRRNTGVHDGEFVFPGGKRRNNETWKNAACRELYEETGLVVKKDKLQKLCYDKGRDPNGTRWLAMFYYCFIDPGLGKGRRKEPNKHRIVQWLPLDNLPKEVPSTVRKVLSELDKLLPKSPKEKS